MILLHLPGGRHTADVVRDALVQAMAQLPAPLRFPKGSDLRVHGPEQLAAVASELNTRPRKTLDWDTPTHRLTTSLRVGNKQE